MTKAVEYRLVATHSEDDRTNYLDSSSPLGPFVVGDAITFHSGSLMGTFYIEEQEHEIFDGITKITSKTTLYVGDEAPEESD